MAITENTKAPAFKLKNTAGKVVQLSDFKGKSVALFFYPKDDTPGCTKEACAFRDLKSEFDALNAVILGVSPDESESHESFSRKFNLNFELLCDPTKKTMEKYGAWGEKNMYGKVTIGVIRSTTLIDPEGKVIKHWKRISKADQHPHKVLEILSAHSRA